MATTCSLRTLIFNGALPNLSSRMDAELHPVALSMTSRPQYKWPLRRLNVKQVGRQWLSLAVLNPEWGGFQVTCMFLDCLRSFHHSYTYTDTQLESPLPVCRLTKHTLRLLMCERFFTSGYVQYTVSSSTVCPMTPHLIFHR